MKKCLKFTLAIVFIVALMLPGSIFAHPGRTDSSGCHTCRTNCTRWGLEYGEYHCHRSKGVPQPLEPIRSHRGPENGVGFTTPAPEYKEPVPVSPIKVTNAEQERMVAKKPEVQENKESWLKRLLQALF